jgi:hypothetical protein
MSSSENYSGLIRKIEWAIMAMATSLLVIFHLIFLRHVGGFWRDEVNTVHLATMFSLAEMWDNLQHALLDKSNRRLRVLAEVSGIDRWPSPGRCVVVECTFSQPLTSFLFLGPFGL